MQNKRWLIIPTLLTAIIILLAVLAYRHVLQTTTLNKQQIQSRIETLYGGEVQSIVEQDDAFAVTFSVKDAIYEVIALKDYGMFEQLSVIKPSPTASRLPESASEPSESAPEADPKSESDSKPMPKLLNEKEIIEIAKQQVDGEIDELELIQTKDGGYYIVEIENSGSHKDDVTLQIHAITGKVMSVSFEGDE